MQKANIKLFLFNVICASYFYFPPLPRMSQQKERKANLKKNAPFIIFLLLFMKNAIIIIKSRRNNNECKIVREELFFPFLYFHEQKFVFFPELKGEQYSE